MANRVHGVHGVSSYLSHGVFGFLFSAGEKEVKGNSVNRVNRVNRFWPKTGPKIRPQPPCKLSRGSASRPSPRPTATD
jgi:hypothetical protein